MGRDTHDPVMTQTLLSLGHGYSAQALARLLPGWRIIATTRSQEKAERLVAQGAEVWIWPGGDLRDALSRASHVLSSIAPDDEGDPVIREIGSVLAESTHLRWVGYLSTTGVYGDHDGAWVDEETPLEPTTRRGKARMRAEAEWRALGLPLHIFRLAGIYGPGRGPFQKVKAGTARRIIKQGQVFSRIHVEDIAQALAASIARPRPGAIYNVCDDDPAPPQDVIEYAARILGRPVPPAVPFDRAEMTSMARSFYAESKRVRNDRMKKDLGISLKYPTYREGLAASQDED